MESETVIDGQIVENKSQRPYYEQDSTKKYIVNVHDLRKYYGPIKAVDGIDLQIERGSIFGFLGPNGAGKTTTISCLITLLHPTGGAGTVAGFDLYNVSHIRSKVAGVFQEQTLDEQLTGRQNLNLHAELYHIPKKIREERITSLVEMVGLTDRIDDAVIKYSGGMRRRLEIARGLLTEPEILFLDEPTIGLDPQSRSHIWDKIREMNKTKNITIFITTHAMDEAEALCDQIAIIDKGKIVIKGTADELKASLGQDMISVQLADVNRLAESAERVKELPEVENVKISDNKLNIGTKNGPKLVAVVAQALNSSYGNAHIEISSIEIKKPSLNDVFMYYTGKSFRDAEDTSLAERLTMHGRKQRGRGGWRGGHR